MGNQQKQTYCLKPISEAKDCKEYCHTTFRRVCLDRFSDYIYNNLAYQPEEKKENSLISPSHPVTL